MIGINGYTICSGIICEELNGAEYVAVRLDSDEKMTIGYLTRRDMHLSKIGMDYLEVLGTFKAKDFSYGFIYVSYFSVYHRMERHN